MKVTVNQVKCKLRYRMIIKICHVFLGNSKLAELKSVESIRGK